MHAALGTGHPVACPLERGHPEPWIDQYVSGRRRGRNPPSMAIAISEISHHSSHWANCCRSWACLAGAGGTVPAASARAGRWDRLPPSGIRTRCARDSLRGPIAWRRGVGPGRSALDPTAAAAPAPGPPTVPKSTAVSGWATTHTCGPRRCSTRWPISAIRGRTPPSPRRCAATRCARARRGRTTLTCRGRLP